MDDDVAMNQRPAIIAAVIIAALTAAGLWYFFVFRSGELPQTAQETPTDMTQNEAALIVAATPTATPTTPPPTPTTLVQTPQVAAQVSTTASTGSAQMILISALTLTTAGALGLLRLTRRSRAV